MRSPTLVFRLGSRVAKGTCHPAGCSLFARGSDGGSGAEPPKSSLCVKSSFFVISSFCKRLVGWGTSPFPLRGPDREPPPDLLSSSSSSSSLLLSSLELSGTKVYEPSIRARLGTAAHFCEVDVLKLRTAFVSNRVVIFSNYVVIYVVVFTVCGHFTSKN